MRLFFAAWPSPETSAACRGRGEARTRRQHELPIDEARYWKKNEIVWAGPRETPPELGSLVKALKLELYRHEFILERRPFAAHVTLLRRVNEPKRLPPLPAVAWPVEEFLLVRSRASAGGPTYEPVERYPLSE